MHPLKAVRQFLLDQNLCHQKITCALSGGADSVCLLLCLLDLAQKLDLQISAVHIQHHLRGAESLRDEQFCRALCADLHIPLHIFPVNVHAYQQAHTCSEETAARECRYEAFAKIPGWIATAHTASDNLETILFRIARGTGLKGLCGIPPIRGKYIRPLLHVTRAEIESFLHQKQMDFVTDSTNLTDAYQRNFIRHQIIPLIKHIQPDPESSIIRMTELLTQEQDFLDQTAKAAYAEHVQPDGSLKDLHLLHPAIQRRCIGMLLLSYQIPADYAHVESVRKILDSGGKMELIRGQLTAHVSHHVLYLQQIFSVPELPLMPGDVSLYPGMILHAEFCSDGTDLKNMLDYDKIHGKLVLHGRKPGLYFRPVGAAHTISIKKWLQQEPLSQRNHKHFLSDDDGLLWVQGLGTAARAAVSPQSEHILFLHVHASNTECT